MSELEYTTARDDIIAGAGASPKDFNYNTAINKARCESNVPTKHVIDAWVALDENVLIDTAKMATQRANALKSETAH